MFEGCEYLNQQAIERNMHDFNLAFYQQFILPVEEELLDIADALQFDTSEVLEGE